MFSRCCYCKDTVLGKRCESGQCLAFAELQLAMEYQRNSDLKRHCGGENADSEDEIEINTKVSKDLQALGTFSQRWAPTPCCTAQTDQFLQPTPARCEMNPA